MPARKSHKRSRSTYMTYQHLPVLAVSVGVIFFMLQLLLLVYGLNLPSELVGLFTALWFLGGLAFATGVALVVRESRWAVLFLAGPAFSLGSFCLVVALSGFGWSLVKTLISLQ